MLMTVIVSLAQLWHF